MNRLFKQLHNKTFVINRPNKYGIKWIENNLKQIKDDLLMNSNNTTFNQLFENQNQESQKYIAILILIMCYTSKQKEIFQCIPKENYNIIGFELIKTVIKPLITSIVQVRAFQDENIGIRFTQAQQKYRQNQQNILQQCKEEAVKCFI